MSTRTSTASKGDALVAIEHVLAEMADPRAVGLPGLLQRIAGYVSMQWYVYSTCLRSASPIFVSVSSRIVSWTYVASALLDR